VFLAISAAISGIQAQSGRRTQESRGLVLNTAVLYGRAARELWILDVDDPTPQLEAAWTKRKHIVHEEYIIAHIPSTVIGGDTLLRDNPVCFLVQNGRDTVEIPAITCERLFAGAASVGKGIERTHTGWCDGRFVFTIGAIRTCIHEDLHQSFFQNFDFGAAYRTHR